MDIFFRKLENYFLVSKMLITRFLFVAINLLLIQNIFSQGIPLDRKDVALQFEEVWTKEHNQSLSSIEAMIQTKDGYIWIGTNNGLFKYDGVRFTIFNSNNTKIFPNDLIYTLFETHDGTLLIGTNKGLIGYHKGIFFNYDFDERLKNIGVFSICEDQNENLYIGTMNSGLIKIAKNRTITKWESIFRKSPINDLLCKGNIIWISNDNNGLVKLENDRFHFYRDTNIVFKKKIRSIYQDSNGALWLGTVEDGVIRYNERGISVFSQKNGLPSNRILMVNGDKDGSIWIGTAGGGLVKIRNSKIDIFTTKDGLNLDAIKSLLFDNEGILWVGTSGGGLNRIKNNYLTTYTMRNGLNDNYIWSANQDIKNNIWIATGSNGVSIIDAKGIKHLTSSNGLKSDKIRTLLCDSRGRTWIGSTDSGVSYITEKKIHHFTSTNGLYDNHVRSIFEDSKNNIWIGTETGIKIFSNGNLVPFIIKGVPSRLSIRYIEEDKSGNIWFATGRLGLFKYNGRSLENYSTSNGLSSNDIISIFCDTDNTFWIATGNGLNRYKNGIFKKIRFGNQFDNQLILHILKDDFNNIWLSSFTGLLSANIDSLNAFADGKTGISPSRIFGKEDGMLSTECNGANQNAGVKTRDGRLWFPTMNGIAVIDPYNIFTKISHTSPKVVIDKFAIDDSIENIYAPTIEVKPGANKYEIHYAALSYKNPNLNRYKYKLEGVDMDWVEVGNRTAAYYTNLSHGEYTFHVIASNSDGIWNTQGAKISFTVLPHYYETFWFLSTAVLLGIAGIYGIYKYRLNNLSRTKLYLQKIVKEQTHQLELELAERKLKETKLRESEERLNFYIEGSKDGFWDWDLTTDKLSFNSRAADIFDCDFNSLPVTNSEWDKMIHPDFAVQVDEEMKKYLKSSTGNFEAEYILITKSGKQKWIFDRGKIVERDQSGNPLRMAGSLTDITLRKRNEEELLKAKKIESIGLLAGGIAHDFNNLLTAILGNISLIRIKIEKHDHNNLFKLLENSETASLRARDLTQQLLTFSKGGQPVTRTTSIAKLIQECTTFILRGSKVKSYFDVAENLWLLDVDLGQINQVVQNLIVNSMQAMPNGGKLFISACNVHLGKTYLMHDTIEPGDYVKIVFKDSGTGIDKEHLERIFDPYFTTKDKGHGLGLSTSYSIIKKHNGYITVDSEKGKGAMFTILLPKSKNKTSTETNSKPEIKFGTGNILIVDSGSNTSDILEEMLGALGYNSKSCKSLAEVFIGTTNSAIDIKNYFAVIFLANKVDSAELTSAISVIKQHNIGISVFVSSPELKPEELDSLKSLESIKVLEQPFKIEELSQIFYNITGN